MRPARAEMEGTIAAVGCGGTMWKEIIVNFLNLDSPVMRVVSRVADLIILNWLFILCSLPIVTAGASLTALHKVILQMLRGEEGPLIRGFLAAFRDNFRKATAMWLLLLALVVVLVVDLLVGGRILPQPLWMAVLASMVLLAVLGLMVLLYAFPLQARYENPVGRTLKNAVLLAILHLPETLLMAAIYLAVPVVIFAFPNTLPGLALLSIFLGFSGVVYLADLAVYRVFRKTTSEERQA